MSAGGSYFSVRGAYLFYETHRTRGVVCRDNLSSINLHKTHDNVLTLAFSHHGRPDRHNVLVDLDPSGYKCKAVAKEFDVYVEEWLCGDVE